MRILIVTGSLNPSTSQLARRWYAWVKYWTLAGHDLSILAPEPSEPLFPSSHYDFSNLDIHTVPAKGWVKMVQGQAEGSIVKKLLTPTLNLLDPLKPFSRLWVQPALQTVKDEKPWDLVVSTSHLFSTHLVAYNLKKQGRARKWILDLPQISSKENSEVFYTSFYKVEEFLTQKVIRKADILTSSNPELLKSLKKLYGKSHVELVAESFDPSEFDTLKDKPIYPKDGRYRIVYSGDVNLKKQNFETFFQAVYSIVSQKEYRLLIKHLKIIFDTPHNPELFALIERYELTKWVKIKPPKSRNRTLMKLRDGNCLLYFGRTSPEIPSEQLLKYLFSKTSILAIGRPLHPKEEELLSQNKAGTSLHNNVEEIKSYLLKHLTIRPNKKHLINNAVVKPYLSKSTASELLKTTLEPPKVKVLKKSS